MKLRHLGIVLTAVAVLLPSAQVAAAPQPAGLGGGDVNQAVAVNTEDGASLFRMAFSVKRVADGVVDQENAAVALASCTDCRTVALAFQVVLVMGGADVVVPTNQAVAYNNQCAECLTFASATQIVVGVDGPVRLTGDGIKQLLEIQRRLRDLEGRIDQLTAAELVTEVSQIETALITILDTELVPVGRTDDPDPGDEPAVSSSPVTSTTTSIGDTTTTTSTRSTTTIDPALAGTTTLSATTTRPPTTTAPAPTTTSTASTTSTTTTSTTDPDETSTGTP